MIIRKEPSGALTFIAQTDHSRFVGQLAAHWGSRDFESPKPYDAVVRAATFHDYGWLRYETSPLVNPTSGEPYPFLQVPMTSSQLAAYQWALDWMADIDPYSGLIVSMHRTGLWQRRYGTIKHPAGRYNLTTLSPEVRAFIDQNEAWQQRQRATLDAKGVWTNYRLMQVWDLLGLYFCCQEPYEDHVDPVPVGYSGTDDGGVRMAMTPVGPRRVAFDPYPFDVRPCRVQLSFRTVSRSSFEDVEAFRRAWFQADVGLMEFELV
ncbi:MAG: hypothetical protein DMD91_14560 [Candidatus Rokuibacteriota bacterium]|nr:MAG: hypothetical protein DMD91_14560 [Candidatus Rokubacteria bacterium]